MKCRIDSLKMQNYGMMNQFYCDRFSNINVIIGENGTGKTFLLKALYSAVRTLEETQRGDDIRSVNEVLAEKLRWTFQVEKIGDIVSKTVSEPLEFYMRMRDNDLHYRFSKDAVSKIVYAETENGQKEGDSVFIPSKEVLSLFSIILKSREQDRIFGFDDTYYDLVKALRTAPSRGRNYSAFSESREIVNSVIDGRVDYEEESGKWSYKNSRNQKFSIGATSEGVKKIAIMDRLLGNGYLNRNSIIFIDEIESALHPAAICQFLDMIDKIANDMGIQVFITSHSYFVIKKLMLTAMKRPGAVTCISLHRDRKPDICDLNEGMPDNSIIDTSIQLYEQEIEEVL